MYESILSKFPQKYIKFAFAYGSGVFEQIENKINKKSTMIDFVFVVDDSIKFHDENLRQNPSHYSSLKYLGPYYINKIQNDFGAACYYNTLVKLRLDEPKNDEVLIKYGIISEEALIRDLFDWDYLYMSGRLHKPVKIIKKPVTKIDHSPPKFAPKETEGPTLNTTSNNMAAEKELEASFEGNYNFETFNKSIEMALQTNLQNVLHTSLLLLPEKFTLEELFMCITSISYSGDLRMVIGENKQKVANIVRPQMERFSDLYKPYLIKESFEKKLDCNFETGRVSQDLTNSTIYHHMNQLPKNLLQKMIHHKFRSTHYYDMEEFIYKLTNCIDYKEIVGDSLKSIVQQTSTSQSLKGLLTAGFLKSVDYSMRKLNKMFKK
jgi:translocator assembly and maintenance protein 41